MIVRRNYAKTGHECTLCIRFYAELVFSLSLSRESERETGIERQVDVKMIPTNIVGLEEGDYG